MRKKLLSVILSVAVALTMIPVMAAVSYAEVPPSDYLCLTSTGKTTVSFAKLAKSTIEFSMDRNKWTTVTSGTKIDLENGDKVYFKGNGKEGDFDYTNYYVNFEFGGEGTIAASGSVMSLLADGCVDHCFFSLFNGCDKLTSAPKLPATTLATWCYNGMFIGCSSLTVAPDLPATEMKVGCYDNMFQDCSNLKSVPELKSKSLAQYCYGNMFQGCRNLTKAPELPATTLADFCYYNMFGGCTSLTSAPKLPATKLAEKCYFEMFTGCTSLTKAPELPALTMADGCYSDMFSDCTGLTSAPKLPATTLAHGCYSYMFAGCTGLTRAPELPATEVEENCYAGMFAGCTGLTRAPKLPAIKVKMNSYSYMFDGCTGLRSTPELPAEKIAESCYAGMFSECTGLTSVPELPATQVAEECYAGMFAGCTGLKSPAALPAKKLSEYCYAGMFYGCTGIELSETSGVCVYMVPQGGGGDKDVPEGALEEMFAETGGSFTGTPEINKKYYLSQNCLVKVNKVEPTVVSYGVRAHYRCAACGKYYEDSEGKTEIKDIKAWKAGKGKIDKIPHVITVGADSVYKLKSNKSLTFESNGIHDGYFTSVLIDNEVIDYSNYSHEAGSIRVTLKPDYLEALSTGKHTLAIRMNGADDAVTQFYVKGKGDAGAADTGDDNSLLPYSIAMMIALAGIGLALRNRKEN